MRRFAGFLVKKASQSSSSFSLIAQTARQAPKLGNCLEISAGRRFQPAFISCQPFSSSARRLLFGKTPGKPPASGSGNQKDSKTNSASKRPGNKVNKQQQQEEFPPARQAKSGSKSSSSKSSSSSVRKWEQKGGKMAASSVKLDKARQQFTLNLGDGKEARIEYKPLTGNKIDMFHTEVPVELRNRGIGQALARGALERASEERMRVKLTCSYLINYLDKFADEKLKRLVEK